MECRDVTQLVRYIDKSTDYQIIKSVERRRIHVQRRRYRSS